LKEVIAGLAEHHSENECEEDHNTLHLEEAVMIGNVSVKTASDCELQRQNRTLIRVVKL
tara:strand:+ start:598 stop:774 length:177 start_codon:yes stop_codon:yes gene_type:complete